MNAKSVRASSVFLRFSIRRLVHFIIFLLTIGQLSMMSWYARPRYNGLMDRVRRQLLKRLRTILQFGLVNTIPPTNVTISERLKILSDIVHCKRVANRVKSTVTCQRYRCDLFLECSDSSSSRFSLYSTMCLFFF